MKRLWLVRLGKFGEGEAHALATGELVTGFTISDLKDARTRPEILKLVEIAHPEEKAGTLQNWAVQINLFRNEVANGDLIVVPLKTTGQIAIGEVEGDYFHAESGHPARRVRWLVTDLPRDAVRQDLLYSLGATGTVCGISRNDAVNRFTELARSRRDPGQADGRAANRPTDATAAKTPTGVDDEPVVNLASAVQDQIERHIAVNFTGHAFTELIAAVLRAQGYQARVTPPGADRGIDIVAGQGALGFGGPRLVVQVKSGSVVADQPTLQSLLGSVQDAHADHGLLVSWSGFTTAVRQRVNELYFRVRLWGREEILAALLSVYEQLPEETRAELPLKRLWTLVPDERLDV